METTSRRGPEGTPGGRASGTGEQQTLDGYLRADFPWYGLDEAFTGPRWLTPVGVAADGALAHGSTGHGDIPSIRNEHSPDEERFAVVVTVPGRPVRNSPDGTGVLEATSVSTAAWLAGAGLLAATWPTDMERALRQDWMDQQTAIAWELADDLSGAGWSTLSLPVDGVPTDFHYRESEYGWVLAGPAHQDLHIGAYGRGMSAYGLGFAAVKDIASYDS